MDTTVKVVPKTSAMLLAIISSIINSILFFSILGIGIYLIFLLVKALRIYIKKNS